MSGTVSSKAKWRKRLSSLFFLAMPVSVLPAESDSAQPTDESAAQVVVPSVVVTARRQGEESLQDVPISMVVLDGKTLANAGLSIVTDLQERVPGLLVTAPNPRLTIFTIRGLGSSSFNDGIESSVGLFMDGVYLGRQGLSIFDLVDLERIEVLRGPQGTLFGKNTTAGAIQILTKLPSDEFSAQLETSFGNYDSRQLRGSVTGPLLEDTLAGRLTGYLTRREGLTLNEFDGALQNDRDRAGLRGQFLWTPSDALRGRFIAEYGRVDEDCCAYPLVAPIRPEVTARDEYMEYARVSSNPFDRRTDTDEPTHVDVSQRGASAEFIWDVGERERLTSLSAWRDWRFVPRASDVTSLELAFGGIRNAQEQFTQEVRLELPFESFDSVLGLFYLHQDIRGRETGELGEDLAAWVFGGLLREQLPFATRSNSGLLIDALIPPDTLDGMIVLTPYQQDTDSLAGFSALNWRFAERFELSAGLRYTQEWKRAQVSRSRSGGNPDASVLALTNNLTPLGELIGRDLSGVTFDGLLDDVAGGEFFRRDKREEGNVSGQLALSYSMSSSQNFYATAARGYKSGGINLGVTGETVKPTFRPEISTMLEVGVKGLAWRQRLTYALAVYDGQVRDYQALTFDEDVTFLPNPRQTNLLNVGRVHMQGVEGEAGAALARGLSLRAGLAYNRAITTDFTNAPDEITRQNTKDLSGRQLYNAPRWSGTLGLEYSVPVFAGMEVHTGLDYSFRSGTFATVEQGPASYVDAYALTNLRIGLREADERWDVVLWSRNVFDEDYVAAVQAVYGVGDYGAFAGDPRTFGLSLRARLD